MKNKLTAALGASGFLFCLFGAAVVLLPSCAKDQASTPVASVAPVQPAANQPTVGIQPDGGLITEEDIQEAKLYPPVSTAESKGPDVPDSGYATDDPNPPADVTVEQSGEALNAQIDQGAAPHNYSLPAFSKSWGLTESVYDRTVQYYNAHHSEFTNDRFVTIVDMNKRSSTQRLFLFDLASSKPAPELHLTTHGSGSDPANSGYAKYFSNVDNSLKTSLGAYKTLYTYYGEHGTMLRLQGLESTNSNVLERGIVMHSADYVSEKEHYAGRSWGCVAMDPKIAQTVITRVKSGSLLMVWK